jgi:hypothetical protein
MDLYLNELSIVQAENILESKNWMYGLVNTYKSLEEKGFNSIRISKDIYSKEIAHDYQLKKWLNDPTVDQPTRLFLKKILSNKPYIDYNFNYETDSRLYEFNYLGQISIALGLSYITDSISISLLSDKKWDKDEITIIEISLEEDDEDISENSVTVRHVSKAQHINSHISWIDENKDDSISNEKIQWNKQADKFLNKQAIDIQQRCKQPINTILDRLNNGA